MYFTLIKHWSRKFRNRENYTWLDFFLSQQRKCFKKESFVCMPPSKWAIWHVLCGLYVFLLQSCPTSCRCVQHVIPTYRHSELRNLHFLFLEKGCVLQCIAVTNNELWYVHKIKNIPFNLICKYRATFLR